MTNLITIKEAANFLRINRLTLYRWIKEGKVRTVKVESELRISKDYLENEFLKQG